jgi:catalase-peroxidase
MMLTTDLALKIDPIYEKISKRFLENPEGVRRRLREGLVQAHAPRHGPAPATSARRSRREQLWQDPVPAVDHALIDAQDIAALKRRILASGLSIAQLVSTAWASASTFRGSDKRGGANGARIRLAPQKDWEVNQPAELAKVLAKLEGIQQDFNAGATGGKKVSLADLIVLGGCAGVEQAAKRAGHASRCRSRRAAPTRRRSRPTWSRSPCSSRIADGFRNYVGEGRHPAAGDAAGRQGAPADADRAGDDGAGRRPARARTPTTGGRSTACSPSGPETLTNDFFVNLLDMGTEWRPGRVREGRLRGRDRKTGAVKWTATAVDLVFGSNSQLRALAEVYASATRRRSSCATSWRPGTR